MGRFVADGKGGGAPDSFSLRFPGKPRAELVTLASELTQIR